MMFHTSFNRLLTVASTALALTLTACGASPTAPNSLSARRTVVAGALAAHPTAAAAPKAPVAARPVKTAIVAAKAIPTPAAIDAALPAAVSGDSSSATAGSNAPVSIEMNGGGTDTSDNTGGNAAAGTASAVADSAITAEIVDQKNGVIFGMGTYKCSVLVTNTAATSKTALLKVTFMNGTNVSKTQPSVQLISLAPKGTQTLQFADKKWSTDSAVVSVAETQADQPMAAFVTATKNGVLFGLGAYKATVEVVNPDRVAHTATLVVSFTHGGGKASATAPVRTTVTLQPNTAQSFDFSDPKWSTNAVTATLE